MCLAESPPHGKVSEFRNKKPISQTFDEAIASGDVVSSKTVKNQDPVSTTASISPSARVEEESLSECSTLCYPPH